MTLLPLVALAACPFLSTSSEPKPPQDPKPLLLRPNQPAPPMEAVTWIYGVTSKDKVSVSQDSSSGGWFDESERESLKASKQDPLVQKLHLFVVIVVELPPDDADFGAKALPMLRDLALANSDRWLKTVYLTAPESAEACGRILEGSGIDAPLGTTATPGYVDPADGARTVFVVGRSGELVWKGDAVAGTKEFLAAVKTALGRHAAPAIPHSLAAEVEPALAEYYAGKFEVARGLARKIADGKKPGAADARLLLDGIEAHQRDLVTAADGAAVQANVEKLVELDQVLQRGFKAPVSGVAAEHLKQVETRTLMPGRVKNARDWIEMEQGRPLFFPLRRDEEGKRHAKELERFTKADANMTLPIQRAKKLLERFSAAK